MATKVVRAYMIAAFIALALAPHPAVAQRLEIAELDGVAAGLVLVIVLVVGLYLQSIRRRMG